MHGLFTWEAWWNKKTGWNNICIAFWSMELEVIPYFPLPVETVDKTTLPNSIFKFSSLFSVHFTNSICKTWMFSNIYDETIKSIYEKAATKNLSCNMFFLSSLKCPDFNVASQPRFLKALLQWIHVQILSRYSQTLKEPFLKLLWLAASLRKE